MKIKKTVIIIIMILLTAASTAFADTDMDPQDFLYLTSMNQALYPELDYESNPAFLAGMKEKFLLGNILFNGFYNTETKTRIDDSIGAAGGTETVAEMELEPELDFTYFVPRDDKTLIGWGMNFQSVHNLETLHDLKYNGATENIKNSLSDNSFTAGTDLYFAPKPTKELSSGYAAGYSFSYDPAKFKWITDSTVAPALIYTESISDPDYSADYSHGLEAAAGFIFPNDNGELRLSLEYGGVFTDSSEEYVEVDTDGDGYNDKIYALYEYLDLAEADGGPAENVTGKDLVSYTFSNDLNLNVGFVWELEKYKSIIFTGSWKALGLVYDHYARHILTEAVPTDVSYLDKFYNSGLSSFNAGIAYDLYDNKKKLTFRVGAWYSLYTESFSQQGDSAAGTMLFSSQNPGNFEELSLGLEPENNSLSSAGIYPASQIIHGAVVDACWRWTPEKKVTLFLDLGAGAFYDLKTYKAFNLDTMTVWQEAASAAGINWMLDASTGISFPIGEKIDCMIDLSNIGFFGDFSFADETHMYDSEILRYSDNGSGYLLDDFDLSMNLDVSFKWGF